MGESQRLPIRNRLLLCLAARQPEVSPALRDALIAEAQAAVARITSDDAAYRVSIAVTRHLCSPPTIRRVGCQHLNGVLLGGISIVLEIRRPIRDLDDWRRASKACVAYGDRIVADRPGDRVYDVVILDAGASSNSCMHAPVSSEATRTMPLLAEEQRRSQY